MRLRTIALSLLPIIPSAFAAYSSGALHTTGRWIVDSNNARFKLRCSNWVGHLETNTPEGLQHQPVDTISAFIANAGFNCVRLTYSIDMALGPNVTVAASFAAAGAKTGVPQSDFDSLYRQAVQVNPFLGSATLLSAYTSVISSLNDHGIAVILDNHVSRGVWCCNFTDGNGWFSDSSLYVASNSQYFDTPKWLQGLQAMAIYAKQHLNVIGMSLRNEMRPVPVIQDPTHSDWYSHVTKGAQTIYGANPNLLIVIGGINGATDASFLRTSPLNTSTWPNRTVWEFHIYSFSVGYTTSNCAVFQQELGAAAGFLLEQNEGFTGPLWLSEFGVGMAGGNSTTGNLSSGDYEYLTCLVQYMEGNDAEWDVWAIGGDYYVREGQPSVDESYGVLTKDWSTWRNPLFKGLLGTMWNINQTP